MTAGLRQQQPQTTISNSTDFAVGEELERLRKATVAGKS